VRPAKFRDVQEFDALVADLCAWRTALALDSKATTSSDWRLHGSSAATPEERLIVLRAAMRDFGLFDDLASVQREAVSQLKRDDALARIGRGAFDPHQFGRVLNAGGDRVAVPATHPLAPRLSSLPAVAPAGRKMETLDTPENQFVKFAVDRLHDGLGLALAEWRSAGGTGLERWAREAERRLRLAQRSPFFNRVSRSYHVNTGSPGLHRRLGYRGVLQTFLEAQAGLSLPWEELSERVFGETRDVATLYEIWCLLKMREILHEVFEIEFDLEPFVIDQGGLRLKRGGSSVSKSEILAGDRRWRLKLSYNRAFSPTASRNVETLAIHSTGLGSWSKMMKPDLTLSAWPAETDELSAASAGTLRLIHFDAKYRLRHLGALVAGDAERGFKPDDLDKMHAYASGIQHSVGAYVLYPGDQHQRFGLEGREAFGVGAVSLIPGTDRAKAGAVIGEIIRSALN
ncbi:MAG: DUF2357 domain-containing protein, partial [Brevundimonas sp.]